MPTPDDPGTGSQGLTRINLDLLITRHPHIAGILARRGMLCVGCPIARFHTLEDAATLYDLDLAALVGEIEAALSAEQT
ncbi:MAG: DUF1858 domain-containing protein [Anaerolineae bacterium]|nr:DUF1858 domain-containing protein [Anaerolineae bacterium]